MMIEQIKAPLLPNFGNHWKRGREIDLMERARLFFSSIGGVNEELMGPISPGSHNDEPRKQHPLRPLKDMCMCDCLCIESEYKSDGSCCEESE